MSEHQPDHNARSDSGSGSSDEPTPGAGGDGDFDPYRYGRPDPNPTHDAFGRPIPQTPPAASYPSGAAQQPGPSYQSPYQTSYPPPPGYVTPWHTGTAAPGGFARPSNGMATAGLVLGIVSLVAFWLTFLDIPLIALGIIFSAIGIARGRRTGIGKGAALTGLILSLIAAIVVTVILIIVIPKYNDCSRKHKGDTTKISQCITGDD